MSLNYSLQQTTPPNPKVGWFMALVMCALVVIIQLLGC